MKKFWILVANKGTARIIAIDKANDSAEQLEEFTSEEAHLMERDLVSDRPGRGSTGSGSKFSVENDSEHKQQNAIRFAHVLSQYLDENLRKKKYHTLVLMVAPQFLGLLRKSLSKNVMDSVEQEIDKDLTKLNINEIQNHI